MDDLATARITVQDDNVIPMVKPAKQPPKGDDWLSPMAVGTQFLVRPKGRWELFGFEFEVMHNSIDLYRLVKQNIFPGEGRWDWVLATAFCAQWDLVTIIKEEQ